MVRGSTSAPELAGHPKKQVAHHYPRRKGGPGLALKASRGTSPQQAKTPASVLRFPKEEGPPATGGLGGIHRVLQVPGPGLSACGWSVEMGIGKKEAGHLHLQK